MTFEIIEKEVPNEMFGGKLTMYEIRDSIGYVAETNKHTTALMITSALNFCYANSEELYLSGRNEK